VISFSKVGRREVQAAFDGGDITSDGGLVLLREGSSARPDQGSRCCIH
jgi:hypothetical protein